MRAVIVMLSACLAGCQTAASPPPTPDVTPPINYRVLAKDHLKATLFDPYSVRDAKIAKPVWVAPSDLLALHLWPTGWGICTQLNARNRMGGYIGKKQTLLMVRNGAIHTHVPMTEHDGDLAALRHCKDVAWEPFPEMEEARR